MAYKFHLLDLLFQPRLKYAHCLGFFFGSNFYVGFHGFVV